MHASAKSTVIKLAARKEKGKKCYSEKSQIFDQMLANHPLCPSLLQKKANPTLTHISNSFTWRLNLV